MKIVFGISLTIVLLAIFIFNYIKYQDIFSPLSVFAFFQFVQYVPNIMFGAYENQQILDKNTLLPVFLFETLYILSVCIGFMAIRKKKNSSIVMPDTTVYVEQKFFRLKILILYSIGLVVKLYMINKSGGIGYVLLNSAIAYQKLTTGSGYLEIFKYFSYTAIVLMIYFTIKSKKVIDVVIAFFMILIYMALDLVYSRRSTSITLIIIVLFCVNYFSKKMKISTFLKPKYIIVIIILVLIIVVMPSLRDKTLVFDSDRSQGNIIMSNASKKIFDRLSLVGRDVFVYEYFNIERYWLGRSYLNIFVSYIPSKMWSNKPAVDEGVYLKHLLYGEIVSPNDSVKSLIYKESLPFSTPGLLYANFGIVGIIYGGLLLGIIYKKTYQYLIRNKDNIFAYIFYRIIVFDFGVTVFLLFTVIAELIVGKICSMLFRNPKLYRME